MINRCELKTHDHYKDYGGRGIKVCPEWHDSKTFIDWSIANGYKKGLQIDRIDNDGDYCPSNCRFVTPRQNHWNTRSSRMLTINGETKCVAEWAHSTGLNRKTVQSWVSKHGKQYAVDKIAAWAAINPYKGVTE